MKKILIPAILFVLVVFWGCEKKNQPPTCDITSPEFGATFKKGELVNISVDASDKDGTIIEVRFYIDGVGKYSSKSFPYNYEWDTGSAEMGSHLIRVVAIDDGNLEGEATLDITIDIIVPTVITGEIKDISYKSAICTGEVTDDGGAEITERGICWSTSNNPTIDDNKTIAGNGEGSFEVRLNDLEPGTSYYVKAYAINKFDTFYGNENNFKSDELSGDGIFTYEGREYQYKTIGNQTWMIENLAYLPSVSSSSSGSDSSPYYYVYGYEGSSVSSAKGTDNYRDYGVLYNWEAAKTACPSGWHLPSDEEWKTLEKYLGMSSSDADDTGRRYSGDVGKKLKSTSEWYNNGNGDNSSGFNALPGGLRRDNGGFNTLGYYALFWSSSENGSSSAWYRILYYDSDGVNRYYDNRRSGCSVRCLKN